MSGCIGCLPGKSEQQQQLETITKKAEAYAKEKEQPVAIYKDENGTYQFANAYTAYSLDIPLPKWYRSITTLPLYKFIEVAVDGNFSALTISGSPSQIELQIAWADIQGEYSDAMGGSEVKSYLNKLKEITRLKVKLQIINDMVVFMRNMDAVEVYGRAYYGGFADRLNKMLATNPALPFDHTDTEAYLKDVSRCVNRAKGFKIDLDLKEIAFEQLEKKNKPGENKKPTREHYLEWLYRLSDLSKFNITESITVHEFCSRVKAYNKYCEDMENHYKKK